jgi:hypothetical protein
VNAHGDGASRERANKAGAVGYIDDPVHFRSTDFSRYVCA